MLHLDEVSVVAVPSDVIAAALWLKICFWALGDVATAAPAAQNMSATVAAVGSARPVKTRPGLEVVWRLEVVWPLEATSLPARWRASCE
jgi:hypothetical protein